MILNASLCARGSKQPWRCRSTTTHVAIAVVAVNVMRVLLFVLDGSMLKECEGDINAGMGDG